MPVGRGQRERPAWQRDGTRAQRRGMGGGRRGEGRDGMGGREDFVKASQVSTHRLVIVTLATVLGGRHENTEDKLGAYLVSSEFKVGIYEMGKSPDFRVPGRKVLSPRYRQCSLTQTFRVQHIRLNPGTYWIPPELRSEIIGSAFNSAVSRVATVARSEIKHKMTASWKTKMPIYDLIKTLTWNSSQEMMDRIWGHFTWIQLALADYNTAKAPAEGFWAMSSWPSTGRKQRKSP
ncbi:hypothetical protein DFH08DRAFT_823968 [Mycena albidolilacea]|uniref:Uncharacterized protein n=1 Tax=Mycena albidolilacea TaxID=1033008 RepID=A0AAD6Z4W9_9AGAR|nr:hypothetical protein DFH08DRAFT_823968 [Mycena albidolilacea]